MIGLMIFGSIGIIGLIFFTILYKIKSNKWRALFASFAIFCAWGSLNVYKLSSDYKLLQDKCSDNSQYIVHNTIEVDYLNTAYENCSVGRSYMNNSYFKGFDCKETGYKIADGEKVTADFYYRYHRDKFMRDKCSKECAYYIEEISKPEIELTVESSSFNIPDTNVHVASN